MKCDEKMKKWNVVQAIHEASDDLDVNQSVCKKLLTAFAYLIEYWTNNDENAQIQ